jgi:NADPH-dependent curcumin reductase CurA
VGSAAAQIGRILGCRVVGIAGSEAKVAHLREDLRLHAAIDYKAVPDLHAALVAACPAKIDIYFDNVGGHTFDATTRWMNYGFRYVVCGQIAQYNDSAADIGPRHLKTFEVNRARLQGFGVREYRHRYDEGIARMVRWIDSGELVYREDIVDGLENAPDAFIGMLQGRNLGKQLVRVAAG